MLASMLSNHPAIDTAGELPTFIDLSTQIPVTAWPAPPYPAAVRQLSPEAAADFVDRYLKRLRRDSRPEARHVVDKNPFNFQHLGLIARLFPQARVLHCTRHPLDTGLSNYFQHFARDNDYSFELGHIGHFYGQYLRLMDHWRTVLPLPMLDVSYEAMIGDTEAVARRVLEFVGVEWEERCLAPHTNRCAVDTASNWQVRQPIYQHSVGRWRNYERHLAELKAAAPTADWRSVVTSIGSGQRDRYVRLTLRRLRRPATRGRSKLPEGTNSSPAENAIGRIPSLRAGAIGTIW